MEERDKDVIRRMYVRLERNLEAASILGYLYQECVLSEDDKEKINHKKTSKKRVEKLIKILKKRKNGLKMLIKALIMTKVQDFLAYELLEKVTWSQEEKNVFQLELEGKVDEQQMMEAQMATMKGENDKLRLKCRKYEERLKMVEPTVSTETKLNEIKRTSSYASGRNLIPKFFRKRSKRSQNKPHTTEWDFSEAVRPTCLTTEQSCQTSPTLERQSLTSPKLHELLYFSSFATKDNTEREFDASTSVSSRTCNLFDDLDDPFAFRRQTSFESYNSRNAQGRKSNDHRRHQSSRSGSIVSSASLKMRNTFMELKRNQAVQGYKNLDDNDIAGKNEGI